MASDPQDSPFIKHLASSDKKIRDQALDSLRAYLSKQTSISELDLLKLWKGLFYCLWMQDKPALQQRLSLSLAALPSSLHPSLILPFHRAFWITMVREWAQIDALRLDKYLFLIRQYVAAGLRWLAADDWADRAAAEGYVRVLEETGLSARDAKVPNGLRYHVLDVYVDELERVESGWAERMEVLGVLLGPVERLAEEGWVKAVRVAARECLEDERVRAWRGEDGKGDGEGEEEEEWGGIED